MIRTCWRCLMTFHVVPEITKAEQCGECGLSMRIKERKNVPICEIRKENADWKFLRDMDTSESSS